MQKNYWNGEDAPDIPDIINLRRMERAKKNTRKLAHEGLSGPVIDVTGWRNATPEEREHGKPMKRRPWWAFWR